jgi:hypothetical protein
VAKGITVALGLVAVLGLAGGCDRSATSTTTTGRVLTVAPSSCPRTAPTGHPAPTRPGMADQLVPPVPVRALVCRFEGLNGPAAAGALVSSRVVSGRALAGLVVLFDSHRWHMITAGSTYSCPSDDGAIDVVRFSYASGPSVDVSIALGGCEFASNGVRTVQGYALGQRLSSLVGSPSRPTSSPRPAPSPSPGSGP